MGSATSMNEDRSNRDDLVEPEGVNAGATLGERDRRPFDEVVHRGHW